MIRDGSKSSHSSLSSIGNEYEISSEKIEDEKS